MKNVAIAAAVVFLAGLTGGTRAQDKAADPTGSWTWAVERQGEKREVALKLAAAGGKLTGALSTGKGDETPIADGSFTGGEVRFTVTRERNGEKFTSKYAGKLAGDSIKGSYETTVGGKEQKRDWEAKRVK
ncbi:MAG TPA: hypothetical protein VH092_38675 [Urbifossiella sp.]|nr:hypothetical protein [Urbifossiella sp.]